MCIRSHTFRLVLSSVLIVNIQISSSTETVNHKKLLTSQSMAKIHENELTKIPFILSDKNKRPIYHNFNHINDRITRHRISTIKPINNQSTLSKVPSLYLQPPSSIAKHHWNKVNNKSVREKVKTSNMKKNSIVFRPNYIRDHDPTVKQRYPEVKKKGNDVENKKKINEDNSKTRDRVNFHIHGHQGPDSYIFGYDTGPDGQFRLEEKHENGTVTGYYGYYDAHGKLRKIYYTSDPIDGYEENTNGHSAL